MKKLITIILTFVLFLPLYAQETGDETEDSVMQHQSEHNRPEREGFGFTRQYFEMGIDAGVGFDNNLFGVNDLLKKDVVLDLNKLGKRIGNDGVDINTDFLSGFFFNVRMEEEWGFGFFTGVEGAIYGNVPKSLITLMTEGNINTHVFSGTIGASGSVFYNIGLTGFAKFGKLRIGVNPGLYIPIMYIPGNSGIAYHLDTSESIKLSAEGAIDIYTPFSLEDGITGPGDVLGPKGFDISLEGEYALFSFLDIGVGISHIPLSAATMRNRMRYTLSEINMEITGNDLLNGDGIDIPDLDFDKVYDTNAFKVHRPLRFDTYVRYKPFQSSPELLVLRSNVGFTFDITGETKYFNAGLVVQTTVLRNMISAYLGTGYVESIWNHKLGLALNFRAFEIDLEGSLRSQQFANSFNGSGYGVNLGIRFGW
jgi:hypothetical protein